MKNTHIKNHFLNTSCGSHIDKSFFVSEAWVNSQKYHNKDDHIPDQVELFHIYIFAYVSFFQC